MIKIEICIIVVLYNKVANLNNNFNLCNNQTLYFIDNSDDANIIEQNSKVSNCISFYKNKGLSYAYNYAINKFKNSHDYLVIFDDDSLVDNDFFAKLNSIILENSQIDVFMPKIISNVTMIQAYPKKIGNNYVANKIYCSPKSLKTINSGLVIKLDNSTLMFNEDFFLYAIDFDYVKRVVEFKKFKIIELKIIQSFSRESKDMKSMLRRVELECNDTVKYYSLINYITNYMVLSLYYIVKFKNIKFGVKCFTIAIKKIRRK